MTIQHQVSKMFTTSKYINKKITDFTSKTTSQSESNHQRTEALTTKSANKRPISPTLDIEREAKQPCLSKPLKKLHDTDKMDKSMTEENPTLQAALGPLVKEFQLLRESVDTVHNDHTDLKQTISKQKEEIKNELADKIESNSKQLHKITAENQFLKKENETLKSRMEVLEQTQLTNNIILTGVQEGPFEPYSTTKLRVYEMIAATYATGNSENDLYEAQKVDITNCNRVGKFRHNYSRPISITFAKRDDKDIFLANKKRLPDGIYANEEYPLHIKRNRDRLCPILQLAKSIPHYANKCKLIQDRLVINGITYKVDDIPNLPSDLAAFKAVEKTNDTHLVFAGDLSPYSNFHYSPFEINSQQFHSAEQWIQYQKALMFRDSYTANRILLADTPIECK